jgi:hypothetical protein
VDIGKIFTPFKGSFKGKKYDATVPPLFYQKNSDTCQSDPVLVARTLEEKIRNGSINLLGKWDELQDLPTCIIPLTLDKTKGRLCHDERFLNLFIKDMPFRLETLKDVPRVVSKGDWLVSTDEKSGYDQKIL